MSKRRDLEEGLFFYGIGKCYYVVVVRQVFPGKRCNIVVIVSYIKTNNKIAKK